MYTPCSRYSYKRQVWSNTEQFRVQM